MTKELEPFPGLVNQHFDASLQQQPNDFNAEQQQWFERIKQQTAHNAEFELDDFDFIPECKREGGLLKAQKLFGKELAHIVQELNGYLIA
ncbi:type I restriction-modification enzyme R subunit C-terminal domain-containing protein [Marinobacter guineae]|uniref:type I restriction-modification enzyme R subunit C-terminal domain-containing protein n=1 Tax=Marinobacter guineae TaxID=432303 RepID=UPI003898E9AF